MANWSFIAPDLVGAWIWISSKDVNPVPNTSACRVDPHSGRGIIELVQWLIVLVYVGALFVFAGQEASSAGFTSQLLAKWLPQLTNAQIRSYVVVVRKTGHVVAYGLLTLMVYYAALKTSKSRKGALLFAIGFAFLVAFLDERYQRRMPHRTGSWLDVAIDGLGIGLVAISILVGTRMKNKQYVEVMEDVEDKSR